MKRNLLHLIYIIMLFAGFSLTFSACKETPEEYGETLDRTLIVYMAGENSLSRYVILDSIEIANSLPNLPEGCRVVLYIDDYKSTRLCVGTREQPMETVMSYQRNVCSTDSTDMEFVLGHIFKYYPAKSYGLVMWSHASGWVFSKGRASSPAQVRRRTFGIDNGQRSWTSNAGPQMEVTTLARVLSHHPHLDFIFFDACFMQCIEVAYELRKLTDWVLGSPAEIPGHGAPYDEMLPLLASHEIMPNLGAQAYYDYYTTGLGRLSFNYRGVLLSVIKTSELPQLAAATAPLLRRLLGGRSTVDCEGVQRYFPQDESEIFTQFYDMSDFFYQHCDEGEYRQWRAALERAVPYRFLSERWSSAYVSFMSVTDAEHCAAVSMFIPDAFYDGVGLVKKYRQLQWYKDVKMEETGW